MRISFLELARQHKEIEGELAATLLDALARGNFILGPEVSAFEEEWASYCDPGAAAAAVGSGTDALALALVASGAVRKGHGDEVITSTLTAGYTALAIMNAGGVPVFADIDPRTYTLAPAAIEAAITPRTRAIVPVHLYGQLADMESICDIAARHGLVVVEDAAQAHGARLAGRPVRDEVRASAFSFYPTKNLGACGDGGAVVSQDADLIARVKSLRQGGHPAALQGETEGRNSRLDEMQAALLRVKLRRLDAWNGRRRALADTYAEALRCVSRLQLPSAREPQAHVFHLYVVEHPERERLRAHLDARGIETMVHYPFLLHQQRLFSQGARHALPCAERIAGRIMSLPLYPQLTDLEARAVADAIVEFEA